MIRSVIISVGCDLWDLVEDMEHLQTRNGLVELFTVLFMTRTLRQVVQVRSARQDKSMEDHSKIRGDEIKLRTVQFKGVDNIEERLKEFSKQGISLIASH